MRSAAEKTARTGMRLATAAGRLLPVCVGLLALTRAAAAPGPGKPRAVNFARDVRPILAKNCFSCHGADEKERKAGLRLDTADGAFADHGGTRAFVPGSPEHSAAYTRMVTADADDQMPPPDSKHKVSQDDILIIKTWLVQGASWDGKGPTVVAAAADTKAPLGTYSAADRAFWVFAPRAQVEPPPLATPADQAWAQSPVDAFVLQHLRAAGLSPSPRADNVTLVRRLYFDLVGLPPTPAQVDAFIADRAPDAYARLVDHLLASPQYGERWGQHWLDLVRFAETDGFEYDTHRPDAYRFRDYVIKSFNDDKPYDRFVTEQLGGDEGAGANDDELLVASGFNRLGPLRKNAGNQAVTSSRNEVLTEMTNVVGSAFLGVTIGCARCHDHKFDPIKQSDYYRIQAFFAATQDRDVPRYTPEEKVLWKQKSAPIQAEIRPLRAALAKASDDERLKLEQKIMDAEDRLPTPLPSLYSVMDDHENRAPIHVLVRGQHQLPGPRVGMRPLGILLPDGAAELSDDTRQPRTTLAKWIVDTQNPLTARVMANRIWLHHFGRGLVATPNDFGKNGMRPSHPELLDWLACVFVERGWSIKQMHRIIVNSATYQQSSAAGDAAARVKDPENILLWHMNRHRLDAEELRDSMLSIAGNLNLQAGGPSVMVPIEKELINALYKPLQWQVTRDPAAHRRRSVYLIAKRNLPLPFMQVFDAPDMQASCPRREATTHAPQALELLNGDLSNAQADILARRLRVEAGSNARAQVTLAFRLLAGRAPTAKERALSLRFLQRQPLREFALAMFNLNAFVYVN